LILKLNDVETNSLDQLLQVYRSIPAGKKVKIEILRKRQILTLELSPGKGL
jgi:S1-C subfamily serine protease